jgi:hypothetical protein
MNIQVYVYCQQLPSWIKMVINFESEI